MLAKIKELFYRVVGFIFSPLKAWLLKHRLKIEVFLFICVLCLIYFWNSIFITIKSGEAGVLYQRFLGGTVTDRVYTEGVHLLFPWDSMHIYDLRVQQRQTTFKVLTVDGLWVEVTASIRYHPIPASLGLLHVKLGPDYVEKMVLPEIQSVLRVVIGQLHAEDVFTTEKKFMDVALQESLLQISEKYVKLDDLLITNLSLPPIVQKAIEHKLKQKQIALEYIYRLLESEMEAKRKKIEAQGIRDFQEIVSEGISEQLLAWRGIEATLRLAESNNAKAIIIGNNKNGLPLIFNTDTGLTPSVLPALPSLPSASSTMNATDVIRQTRSWYDSTVSSFSR